MKEIVKKKNGSSLILVLMAFTVLVTFGMTVLSLTLSSYKKRIVEGKVQSNFYLSEAGVDIAYGNIGKVLDEAIKVGNDGVTVLMEGPSSVPNFETKSNITIEKLDLDVEKMNVLLGKHSDYVNDDGSLNEESIKKKQNEIFKEVYKDYIQTNIKIGIENGNYNVEDSSGINPLIQITNDSTNPLEFDNTGLMDINLMSTYNKENIVKKVSVTYDISVPNYKDTYYVTTNVINLPKNPVWRKALTIGGDMKVSSGDVNVIGDIFVQGTKGEGSGINASGNGAEIDIRGRVSTDDKLQTTGENALINVKGNVYARNITTKEGADGSKIKVEPQVDSNTQFAKHDGSVFVYSTMSLNAESSHINISGGFYGINDDYITTNNEPNENNSSYIFINSDNLGVKDKDTNKLLGSELTIGKEAYITGTASIELNNSQIYETGESISIRGNYIAYTYPLENNTTAKSGNNIGEDNVKFEYLDPLTLAFKKNGDKLPKPDKRDYFYQYIRQYVVGEDNMLFNQGNGISIPKDKIHSTGAFLPNDSIEYNAKSAITPSDAAVISEKRNEYETMVNQMGDDESSSNSTTKNLTTQVSYTTINANIPINEDANRQLILLDGNTNNYAIVAPSGDTSSIPSGVNKILLKKNDVNGIIVIKGNLYLSGPINFKGTIIVNGSVFVGDNSSKVITYDESFVSKFIAYNYSLFNGVFINNSNSTPFKIQTTGEIGKGNSGSNITMDKLIKRKNWNLVK